MRGAAWALVETPSASAAWNMALDSALLGRAAAGEIGPTLRLYAWSPPAVSVGRFQRETARIDWAYCRARGWEAVRRPTGGRALLHQHELTYAIVLPAETLGGAGVRSSYAALNELLAAGLARLASGIAPDAAATSRAGASPNCFRHLAAADLGVAAGKCVGSAQARRGGALLQHGSVILEADRDAWARLFGDAGALVSLNEARGRRVSWEETRDALAEGFARRGILLRAGDLAGETCSLAESLLAADPWAEATGDPP